VAKAVEMKNFLNNSSLAKMSFCIRRTLRQAQNNTPLKIAKRHLNNMVRNTLNNWRLRFRTIAFII